MFRKLFGGSRSDASASNGLKFSVFDVETTGLYPTKHDRIVEVAVVQLDGEGNQLDEFVTLVNPERDVGPTRIHGIATRDVLDAPTFGQVAGDVITRIAGAVLVAHNARFDSDFLAAEISRVGYALPPSPVACTLHLARQNYASLASYKLGEICKEMHIPHESAHSALGDARATAALFRSLLARGGTSGHATLARLGCDCSSIPPLSAWPQIAPSGKQCHRGPENRREDPSYLSGLVSRLAPAPSGDSAASIEYIDLLNRALEDRRVTADEAELLLETATRWGLSQDEVVVIHHNYLTGLVALARADGVITNLELADLREVSSLLGYKATYADQLISADAVLSPQIQTTPSRLAGLSVCFTGESTCTRGGIAISRSDAEQLAAAAGLSVRTNVTKNLDILVLADPDSLSGKAQKARRYGTRLMAETVLWRELGVAID